MLVVLLACFHFGKEPENVTGIAHSRKVRWVDDLSFVGPIQQPLPNVCRTEVSSPSDVACANVDPVPALVDKHHIIQNVIFLKKLDLTTFGESVIGFAIVSETAD